MPTRRLPDNPRHRNGCTHPEHEPPSMMVYKPGTYEHTCPQCGAKKVFTVSGIVYSNGECLSKSHYCHHEDPPEPPAKVFSSDIAWPADIFKGK